MCAPPPHLPVWRPETLHILRMDTVDTSHSAAEPADSHQSIQCSACESALRSPGRESISFLLLDQLTIPLVGCDDHLDRFTALCDLTTDQSATLLDHRPAGGVPCPGCRNAPHKPQHPVIPVGDGGVAVLACPTHESAIIDRFRTAHRIRQDLDASLDAF